MTPIHELLSRLRWDRAFGRGRIEIGYFDRVTGTIQRVALRELEFPTGERRVFTVRDDAGLTLRIPFHRVREVYRDGRKIWQRPPARQPAKRRSHQRRDTPERGC